MKTPDKNPLLRAGLLALPALLTCSPLLEPNYYDPSTADLLNWLLPAPDDTAAGSAAANTEYIYTVDRTNQVEYNGSTGTAFANPILAARDSLGRIFLTDTGNNLVYPFDGIAGSGNVEYYGSAGTAFGSVYGIATNF